MLCPSSRPSAQVFCLPFWIKEAYEGNPNYLRNKLLFEFMRKLFLCSLVVGVYPQMPLVGCQLVVRALQRVTASPATKL